MEEELLVLLEWTFLHGRYRSDPSPQRKRLTVGIALAPRRSLAKDHKATRWRRDLHVDHKRITSQKENRIFKARGSGNIPQLIEMFIECIFFQTCIAIEVGTII